MACGDASGQGRSDQNGRRAGTAAVASRNPAILESEVAHQAAQCANVARRAVCEGERIAQSFTRLAEAAGRIGEVVRLINGITDQANLLALSAAIATTPADGPDGKARQVLARERSR
ncbi:MAG TPA: hypothetical protein PLR41_01835 [Alphaproteobacteria bacterium]|nr:hypothetical protein [Alphaproteobacteria bacterium]